MPMNLENYFHAITMILEIAGAHPRVDRNEERTQALREWRPPELLAREHIGWRPFLIEVVK